LHFDSNHWLEQWNESTSSSKSCHAVNHNSLWVSLLCNHVWVSLNQSISCVHEQLLELWVWFNVRSAKVFPTLEMKVLNISNELTLIVNSEYTFINMLRGLKRVLQILNVVFSILDGLLIFQVTHSWHIWSPIKVLLFTECNDLLDLFLGSSSPEISLRLVAVACPVWTWKADTNHKSINILLKWSLDEVGFTIDIDLCGLLIRKLEIFNIIEFHFNITGFFLKYLLDAQCLVQFPEALVLLYLGICWVIEIWQWSVKVDLR